MTELKQQLQAVPSAPPRINLDQARAFLEHLPRLLETLGFPEQRRIIQSLLHRVWITAGRITKLQPTTAFQPLFPLELRSVHGAGDEPVNGLIHHTIICER